MKKLSIILAVLMAVLFAGCGSEDTATQQSTTKTALSDYVYQLAEYKNVDINWQEGEAKELYDEALNNITPTKKEITDRPVKKGDVVNIDYKGLKDGVAFEGGTAQGADLTIGSGQFIPGFEDGLIGKNAGDNVDLNLTFPENYSTADLAGKAVVFKVKINSITENSYTKDQKAEAKKSVFGKAILQVVVQNSKFSKKLPEKTVNNYKTLFDNYYKNNAQSAGYSDFNAYLSVNGMNESDYNANLDTAVNNQTTIDITVAAIAEKEGIKVTKDEYNSVVSNYAENNSMTISQVEESNPKESVENSILTNKVTEFLSKNSKLK